MIIFTPRKISIFVGKTSTYPLRSAQRNLNKIFDGDDDLSNECDPTQRTNQHSIASQQANGGTHSHSPKSYFELDSLIDTALNSPASYVNPSTENTLTSTTNAKDMNNASMRLMSTHNQKQHQPSTCALKNDVKLNEYNGFGECFQTQSTQQQQQQQQHQQSTSIDTHQLNTQTQHNSHSNGGSGDSQLYGDDSASMVMNNNNHKSLIQNQSTSAVHLPTTPQPLNQSRARNSLVADIVNFSPVNAIMLNQDNVNGTYEWFWANQFFSSF